jgi:DNA-binding NarL/FixJ family response regulator
VVDDEQAVRRGLSMFINLQPDLLTCGEAADRPSALKLIRALKPDLAIVDLRLKTGSGLDLIETLHQRWPELKVLVFSLQDAALYAERALQAGAHGYVTKEEGGEKAIEAIRALLQGKTYLSPRVAEKLRD